MACQSRVIAAPTLADLDRAVHQALCDHDRLVPQATPLLRGVLRQSGRPCGLFYQIEGPRLMASYAIWAEAENRVLCYDSAGARFAELRLAEAPALDG
jgi:hypothetical protein